MALKKIIKENKNKNIEIFFLENDLANYLEKEFKTAKIIFKNKFDSFKVRIIQIIKKNMVPVFIFIYYFLKIVLLENSITKFFLKKIFYIFLFYSLR